jgi:RNA polymerase sigma-70 factor (ECF subfamily)
MLAERAQHGSVEAFEALVAAHQSRVYGLALQLLRDPEDAEDAAQEAFVRCYASLDRYNPDMSFGGWLYRIAYNHCLDVLRRRRRAPSVDSGATDSELSLVDALPDPGPGVEELVERGEGASTLRRALEGLSEEHRRVLTLRYMLDLPYAEMARVLDVPESTVTMRLYHAKKALRARLARMGEGR